MRQRTLRKITAVVAVLGFLSISWALLAQPRRGQGKAMPTYDPETETTVTGTVTKVEEISREGCPACMGGVHLMVKADAETYEVHVGPVDFLKEKNWTFEQGDAVEVIGSKVEIDGRPSLIAREIRRGEETLVLRDERGLPLWRGGRRPS